MAKPSKTNLAEIDAQVGRRITIVGPCTGQVERLRLGPPESRVHVDILLLGEEHFPLPTQVKSSEVKIDHFFVAAAYRAAYGENPPQRPPSAEQLLQNT
jgi:hypothetical protein